MQQLADALSNVGAFLNAGIAGSEFTPLKLIIVITTISTLVWVTRRVTRWLVDRVLARRGVDVGMREALGAIVRYGVISLGALVILQSAGINLTSLNVLVGAIGVGLGFGLQNTPEVRRHAQERPEFRRVARARVGGSLGPAGARSAGARPTARRFAEALTSSSSARLRP